ncbi:MAG: helix-turn-helix domain-containing protein [Nitrospirae bacterium]|nr:helix-turn-helix domain-containing protein [Nitrospirota bacterium]
MVFVNAKIHLMRSSKHDRGVGIVIAMQKKKIKTSREIGERIKKRRKELGISQERLAEILGVTYQQIQRYENGTNKLNVENVQIIAHALSVPILHFFESDETPAVAEKISPYSPTPPEEMRLLRHFRAIKDEGSKNLVIQIARLAARDKS